MPKAGYPDEQRLDRRPGSPILHKTTRMIRLTNEWISASLNPLGAELTSLKLLSTGIDYMWNGNPDVWGKHSPVLFPFVGTLKDNKYFFAGKEFICGRHGFARERLFDVISETPGRVVFQLNDSEDSLPKYPFPFVLELIYEIRGTTIELTYHVYNSGVQDLYFSIGGHPAFAIPLEAGLAYSDYQLEFEKTENAGRWPISKDGLIEKKPIPLLDHTRVLSLSKDLFATDAIVLKDLVSTSVTLSSPNGKHGLKFDFPGFPFLGIWAAKNADFVCIEPWCGIADPVDHNQQLENKEGIVKLEAHQHFNRKWTVTLF